MSDGEALLAAILAHPGEDTPRLAYADWLDEQGGERNEQMAQYIRLAIEQDRPDVRYNPFRIPFTQWSSAPERQRLRLLENHIQPHWQAVLKGRNKPLDEPNCTFDFNRGFPEQVRAPAQLLIDRGDALVRLAPVQSLSVNLSAEHLRPLLERPWLKQIKELNLVATSAISVPPHWGEFALGPALPQLETVWMEAGSLTAEEAAALVKANPFPRLRRLQFGGVGLARSAPVLFANQAVGDLEEVFAYGSHCTTEGIAAIMNCPGIRHLKRLLLPGSTMQPVTIREMTMGRHWANLVELTLYSAQLTDAGAAVLAQAPPTTLQCLQLSMNGIGSTGAAELARSPLLAGLRVLDLSLNPIRTEGAVALATSPHLDKLEWLRLESCNIHPEGIIALAGNPALAGLKWLNLRGRNTIDTEAATALATSPHLNNLQYLWANTQGDARKILLDRFGARVEF
jgi:uncharacterized protein (TIGR02996 family)